MTRRSRWISSRGKAAGSRRSSRNYRVYRCRITRIGEGPPSDLLRERVRSFPDERIVEGCDGGRRCAKGEKRRQNGEDGEGRGGGEGGMARLVGTG